MNASQYMLSPKEIEQAMNVKTLYKLYKDDVDMDLYSMQNIIGDKDEKVNHDLIIKKN